ncbi:MAG: hypothetical protein AAF974_06720 [Cyanobacteria bacterium P01_E01_bin.34]
MAAILVHRYDLFLQAMQLLHRYSRSAMGFHPHGLEVALAICSADRLPWVGDAKGMTLAEIAAEICDSFYRKSHTNLPHLQDGTDLIWPLFNHDGRGVPQPILPQSATDHYWERRWLKACNGQSGIGCHASSPSMWRDEEFLNGDRDVCPLRFYDGSFPMTVDQGRQRCRFDDHPCGWQPGFPKMLQVVGSGPEAEVFRIDWTETMWNMLVPTNNPIPIYPAIAALYFGNESMSRNRKVISPEQFADDLGVPGWQLRQVFDVNSDAPLNHAILTAADQQESVPDFDPFNRDTEHLSSWSIPQLLPQPIGGHILLDPDEPPDYASSGLPSGDLCDPLMAERRRRRQLERTPKHNELLRQFRRWFRLAGIEVREDRQFFDFLAVKDNRVLLAEVKLLYHQDMAESMQELIGQLFYYERFAAAPWVERGFSVVKAAVFDRPPLGEYITFLADLGIATFWLTTDEHIDGSESSLRLLRQMDVQVRADPELLDYD